jgi:hypothetical protein
VRLQTCVRFQTSVRLQGRLCASLLSLSVCAYVCVCEWEEVRAVQSYPFAAPTCCYCSCSSSAAMAAAAAACSSSLLRLSVDATHKNYVSSFVPKASSAFVSSSSSSISSCSCLKGQPLLESRGGGGAVFVGMPGRRPFQVLAMAPPKPSGKAKKGVCSHNFFYHPATSGWFVERMNSVPERDR